MHQICGRAKFSVGTPFILSGGDTAHLWSCRLTNMRSPVLAKMIVMAGTAVFAVTLGLAQDIATLVPQKILFIGDSFTFWQEGVYTHLERSAATANPPLRITTGKATGGGAFLQRLWNQKEPRMAIQTGSYNVVVLQEDIPETTVADFREYARKFVREIRENHGRPVLFMAWAYPKLGWISMAEIARAHRDAATELNTELNVDVAPVGLAWKQASKQRPEIYLFGSDHEHPSIHGTYLATCVIYATVFGRDPTGLAYFPSGVTADEAAFLQKIAWHSVQDYRAGRI